MPLTRADVARLACPVCHQRVAWEGDVRDDGLASGELECEECGRHWPVDDGLARLYDESGVRGYDRLLRPVYDLIAPFHDASVDWLLPVLQFPDLGATRDHYIARLALDELLVGRNGTAPRILEVGIGGGANVPLIESALPADAEVELWGVDLSTGMLEECRRRLAATPPTSRVRLLLADAHALPFPDASFDRVFHVGAINGYHDRRRALAEMARVAKPGTPIVVVDEELDPARRHSLLHWLAFRAITFYDPDPRAPVDALPPEAVDVEVSAVSRFYYCLRFRMPDRTDHQPTRGAAIMPTPITNILTAGELTTLRNGYDAQTMAQILGGFFPLVYPPTQAYMTAITAAFTNLPPDCGAGPRDQLSAMDRERCLVAILASRGPFLGLAIHVYVALMEGVSPGEIAHILFLNGIYTGVENFAESIKTAITVLERLKALVGGGLTTPQAVVYDLQSVFPR